MSKVNTQPIIHQHILSVYKLTRKLNRNSTITCKKLVKDKDKVCLCVLTFTHNPKDFKFIHHITDVREFHEVKRCVVWGAPGSGGGGPATEQRVAASWSPWRAAFHLEAIISDTCLWQIGFTCTQPQRKLVRLGSKISAKEVKNVKIIIIIIKKILDSFLQDFSEPWLLAWLF